MSDIEADPQRSTPSLLQSPPDESSTATSVTCVTSASGVTGALVNIMPLRFCKADGCLSTAFLLNLR